MFEDLHRLPPPGVETRWASGENRTAEKGAAGRTNFGRKGAAHHPIRAGETFTLADLRGNGTVRRIWITIDDRSPAMLRGLVLRAYWDGEEVPAVEAPFGDFFGVALGRVVPFENAWFASPEGRSFTCRLPMPFRRSARIEVANESPKDLAMIFYDVNLTVGDGHGADAGWLHARFRRERPTTLRRDFEILPRVEGRGRFLGCNLGMIADTARYGDTWWGEGEVKVYLDGDGEWPTLCGTGTEDYVATGWGQGAYAQRWHGCPVADSERFQYAFYRLHGPDPVFFHRECRVTIQQIGGHEVRRMIDLMRRSGTRELVLTGDGTKKVTLEDLERGRPEPFALNERQDDWCATAYFYFDRPGGVPPPLDPYERRVEGLTGGGAPVRPWAG